jgi:hypothetical protein
MPISEPFDPATPPGTEAISGGDDRIRSVKTAVRERAERGGHYWPIAVAGPVPSNDTGKHCCGADPQGDTKQFIVYEDDRVTAAVTVDTDDGGIQSVTLGDGIAGSNAYTLKADLIAGKRLHTVSIYIPAVVGRAKGVIFENRGGGVLTILETRLSCFTFPVGGVTQVDAIKISAYGKTTNPNTAGSTIYAVDREPEIADSAAVAPDEYASDVRAAASDYVGSAFPTLAIADALVFDVDTLNGADDLVFTMLVRRVS